MDTPDVEEWLVEVGRFGRFLEAADEIGFLRIDCERYRAALQRIANNVEGGQSLSGTMCAEIAEEALSFPSRLLPTRR